MCLIFEVFQYASVCKLLKTIFFIFFLEFFGTDMFSTSILHIKYNNLYIAYLREILDFDWLGGGQYIAYCPVFDISKC